MERVRDGKGAREKSERGRDAEGARDKEDTWGGERTYMHGKKKKSVRDIFEKLKIFLYLFLNQF